MKKKKIIHYIGATSLGALALGVGFLPTFHINKGNAATLSGTVFEDKFAENTMSNQWLKNDFQFDKNSYYSMRFDNQKPFVFPPRQNNTQNNLV